MNNIFDTHAHYSSRQFDADRAELLTALPAGGVVGVLECATHSGDAAQVLELAHAAPYFHAALGIHPESLIEEDAATVAVYHGDWRAELAAMRPLFADKAVATAGERNVAMATSTTSSSTIKPMSAPGCCTVVWWA